MHLRERTFAVSILAALSLSLSVACDDDSDASGGSGATGATGAGGNEPLPPTSPKALVKLKSGERLRNDIARVLSIEPTEVCKELGKFDCFGLHAASLLEADPGAGLYEPLPESTTTSPIAVDRIVLSACGAAADRGKKGGQSVEPPIDPEGAVFTKMVTEWHREALGRDIRADELSAHRELATTLAAEGASPREVRILSCYATLTSLEFLFY